MASDETGLLRKAKKLESEELAKVKLTPERIMCLDGLLWDVYVTQSPKPIDYYNRRDLVRIFNMIAKEIYGSNDSSPVVEGYGSFVMDMFSKGSDLDLSINFKNNVIEVPRQKKIETLRKFAKKLYSIQRKGHVTGVQTIMTARVPIVKVTDRGTGIECDLSVDNRDGIAKSHIIHAISTIDERFQKLSVLMKSWAKAHDINSSKDHTLNSLSIVSLVAFHLQTCNPPVLPSFSALLNEGADPASVSKVVNNYLNYGKKNVETLAELFITLFVKLASVEKLWKQGLCASLYEGSWISKSWDSYSYSISVEDFTDRSQNVARAVRTEEVKKIYNCIHESLNYLSKFLNCQIEGTKLMDLLFGTQTVSTLGLRGTRFADEIMSSLPTLRNSKPPKKMRLMEGLEERQFEKACERNYFVQGWQGAQPWKGSVEPQRVNVVGGGIPQTFGKTLRNVLASFTPSASYQAPFAIPSSDHKAHHGYGQEIAPSGFAHNPLGSEGPYNPSLQSHLVSPESSIGFVGSFHKKPVAPNPYLRSIHSHLPQSSHNLSSGDHPVPLHRHI